MEPDPSAPHRVEAYLDQILAPLAHSLSQFHQGELRRELRTHLWERVDAYRELGMADDNAVTEALKQFGGAEDFARQWRREWLKIPSPLTLRGVYEAGKRAIVPSLTGILGANLFYLAAYAGLQHLAGTSMNTLFLSLSDVIGWSMLGSAFFLLPLFVGMKHGRRTCEHPGLGMVTALTAEITVTSLLYGSAALNSNDGVSTGTINMLFNFSLLLLVAWIPVAGGAAAVSGWLAEKQRKRMLA